MLTIGIMASGQHEYYLSKVARGAEDYYVYSGEAPGRWMGGSGEALGLVGEVSGDDFRAVLTGHAPDGRPLGTRFKQRTVMVDGPDGDPVPVTYHPRPGYDLTWSAPKSVSILFALGDKELSKRVRDAHDEAVRQGMDYLTRTVSYGRRGRDGVNQVDTAGFLAAGFRHRTSRHGDPQLHTHVIVANKVLGADGKWTAVDSKAIHYQAKTAGTIYQAVLRSELSDLGLEWDLHEHGYAELCCVPKKVRKEFSQRRAEIEAEAARRGVTSGEGMQAATYATRPPKMGSAEDGIRLEWEWINRAQGLGFSREDIDRALAEGRERVRGVDMDARRDEELAAATEVLLSERGLTERSSTFDEKDMLRGLASKVGNGAGVVDIERAARRALTCEQVVAVSGPDAAHRRKVMSLSLSREARGRRWVTVGGDSARYTTTELLAVEQRLVDGAAKAGPPVGVATREAVAAALAAHPHLAAEPEQANLVRGLCLSGRGVDVVHAPAGSGKTTALSAARMAWATSGVHVVGVSLARKAAQVLEEETGIPSYSVAELKMFLADERTGLAPGSVLVVDEASMVGTRDLELLRQAVKSVGGKLVPVGDSHQMPEIDAGGAFKGLVTRLPVIRLSKNRRQVDEDERERVRLLRAAKPEFVEKAMRSYDAAGRVHRAETAEDLRREMVVDWVGPWLEAGSADDREMYKMIARRNVDCDDLNERARVLLADSGVLTGPAVQAAGREFRAGDHVVTRKNKRPLGVTNGESWQVVSVDPEARTLTVHRLGKGAGKVATLPEWYLDAGHLQHGYAITVNIGQGSTLRRVWGLPGAGMHREAGYTMATRGWERIDWWVVEPERELDCCDQHGAACEEPHPEQLPFGFHVQRRTVDPLDDLIASLSRSGWQPMASDTPQEISPTVIRVDQRRGVQMSVEEMREQVTALRAVLSQRQPPKRDPSRRLARTEAELARARGEVEQARVDREAAAEMLDAAQSTRHGLLRRVDGGAVEAAKTRLRMASGRESSWSAKVRELSTQVEALRPEVDELAAWREANRPELARLAYLNEQLEAAEVAQPVVERDLTLDL